MKKFRTALIAVTATALALSSLAGCGAQSNSSDKPTITIFNSMNQIQPQFEDLAEEYSKDHDVNIEVYYSNDTVASHMAARYAANNPYTISMVDEKDVYSLAPKHGTDLSDQEWVKDTDYALSIDNKVYGYPISIAARGIMYNADPIEKITGKKFNPSDYKTLKAFRGLLKQLSDNGFDKSTGIQKEDWSLGAHYLTLANEMREDPKDYVTSIHNGAKMIDDERFNQVFDTFDTLKEHNYQQGDAALTEERELSLQKLASGEIAFMFGGNWDWTVMGQYDHSENMGIMPLPLDTNEKYNTTLVGGVPKFMFIDSSDKTSEAQRKAAKEFLNWLHESERGKKFIVEDSAAISPFKNNTLPAGNPLDKSVKKYTDLGLVPNFQRGPDDYLTKMGAEMQSYLAGKIDRKTLANRVDAYWQAADLATLENK